MIFLYFVEPLERYLFADLENLKQVFLQHNNIDFIHPKAFHDNTKLSRLFIHENKLTNLNKDWFSSLSNLEELYVDSNPFECNCVIQVGIIIHHNKIEYPVFSSLNMDIYT